MQKRKGFTTVELVIVIAVIAILATALIPTFGGLIKSANLTTDKQTANALTTLTTMYAMEHGINSERDLADAINEGMGENYYQNLQAKSAKYGYCFWYDYEHYRVHLGTVEEIAKIAEERQSDPQTQAFSIDDVRLGAAGSTSATNTFGLRADLVQGFVLMGYEGGNELMDLVCDLENASVDSYQKALDAINSFTSADTFTTAAVAKLKENATKTAIQNADGIFSPSANPTAIHIPQSAVSISSTTTLISGNEQANSESIVIKSSLTVVIPSHVTLSTGSLSYLPSSCTVDMNISAEQLKDKVQVQATAAQISLPDGYTYTQITTSATNAEGTLELTYKFERNDGVQVDGATIDAVVKAFGLGDHSEYVVVVTNHDNKTGTVFVSNDIFDTESWEFVLFATDFVDTSNNPTNISGTFTWTKDGASLPSTDAMITVEKGTETFTVETLGLTYTYTVVKADVEKLNFSEMEGKKFSVGGSFDLIYKNFVEGESENKKNILSWTINPQIVLTGKIANDAITLNQEISVVKTALTNSADATDLGWFEASKDANGNIILSVADTAINTFTGDKRVYVTFKCGANATVTKEINLIDVTRAVFDIANNANTYQNYSFAPVVGTVNTIELRNLFKVAENTIGRAKVYLYTPWNGETITLTMNEGGLVESGKTIPYWATYALQIPAGTSGNQTLEIRADNPTTGVPMELTLNVVNGAYNVANAEDWKNCVTYQNAAETKNSSVAIINGFTIDVPEADGATTAGKNALTSESQKYLMVVGSGTVYGNFNTIEATDTFKLYRTYTGNYLISLNGGALSHVILVGPDYGNEVCIDDGDSNDKGTYIGGVYVDAGTTTIEDCFLSGFRSPLWANGGTIKLNRTTLHRGNFANIYVDSVSTIVVDTVTTIQYQSDTGNIGAGIFVKHNSGTGNKIEGTGFEQKNFVTETQINMIAAYAASFASAEQGSNVVFDVSKHLSKIASISHTVNTATGSTTQYNAGIFMLRLSLLYGAKKYHPTLDVSNLYDQNGTKLYTTPNPVEESILWGALTVGVVISGESTESCKGAHNNACAHNSLSIKTQDHLDNFLSGY